MADVAYTIVVVPDPDDGGYYAHIPDLQGCMGDGVTPQDAVSDVINAAECWLAVHAEQGREAPKPGEANQAFERSMKERDDYIAGLESEIASLKAKLREAERSTYTVQSSVFSKTSNGFQAA